MDKTDCSWFSILIEHCIICVRHPLIVFQCFMTHPFEVVTTDLIISGYKESIDVSIQSDVKVNHSPIHVDEDQIQIEQCSIEHCGEAV